VPVAANYWFALIKEKTVDIITTAFSLMSADLTFNESQKKAMSRPQYLAKIR